MEKTATTTNATTTFKPLFDDDKIIVKGDFVINIDLHNDFKTLIAYIGNGGDVTIPNGVNDVYAGSFEKKGSNVTSIHLPDTIEWLDEYAFYGCTNLIRINIPDGVQNIGMGAFKDCKSLKSITIPNSVKTLDYAVFEGCEALEHVKLPDDINDIPERFFYGCSALTSVNAPRGVKVCKDAFYGCKDIQFVFKERATTLDCLTLIRHSANTTFRWYNMTVKPNHYYGYVHTYCGTVVPVFWSGFISNSAIRLYNAITGEWVWFDECTNVRVIGDEHFVTEWDNVLYEWENEGCYGYRPNEGDYLPFWIYTKTEGWTA